MLSLFLCYKGEDLKCTHISGNQNVTGLPVYKRVHQRVCIILDGGSFHTSHGMTRMVVQATERSLFFCQSLQLLAFMFIYKHNKQRQDCLCQTNRWSQSLVKWLANGTPSLLTVNDLPCVLWQIWSMNTVPTTEAISLHHSLMCTLVLSLDEASSLFDLIYFGEAQRSIMQCMPFIDFYWHLLGPASVSSELFFLPHKSPSHLCEGSL